MTPPVCQATNASNWEGRGGNGASDVHDVDAHEERREQVRHVAVNVVADHLRLHVDELDVAQRVVRDGLVHALVLFNALPKDTTSPSGKSSTPSVCPSYSFHAPKVVHGFLQRHVLVIGGVCHFLHKVRFKHLFHQNRSVKSGTHSRPLLKPTPERTWRSSQMLSRKITRMSDEWERQRRRTSVRRSFVVFVASKIATSPPFAASSTHRVRPSPLSFVAFT